MDIGYILAEEKIKAAIRKGDLDHLPGKGKPLEFEDLSGIPAELRTSYKIMKNAGMLPEEMQIKKEMVSLEDLIRLCDDETLRNEYKQKLTEKKLLYNTLMEKRKISTSSGTFRRYSSKIHKRLGL